MAERKPRPQAVLSVLERRQLNAHTVRVVAGGPGFADYRDNEFTDKYAKLLFGDVRRTYTVRRADPGRQRLTIDFVVHGDAGIAAPWARTAEPGDRLTLSGAGGAYQPDPTCDAHVFLGDESALPAIDAALEALPATARGYALLEVSDSTDALEAAVPDRVEVRWLHRTGPGTQPDLLARTLLDLPWPVGRVDVFAHGERESMKAVRAALAQRRSEGDRVSLSGYWAYGRTEDRFQAEKREPIGQLG